MSATLGLQMLMTTTLGELFNSNTAQWIGISLAVATLWFRASMNKRDISRERDERERIHAEEHKALERRVDEHEWRKADKQDVDSMIRKLESLFNDLRLELRTGFAELGKSRSREDKEPA